MSQRLQRKATLSKRSTENHILVYFLLRRGIPVVMLREDDSTQTHDRRDPGPDFQIRHDNNGDLEPGTEVSIVADHAAGCCGGQGSDEGEEDRGRHVLDSGRLEFKLDVRDSEEGEDGHSGIYPPKHVSG